MSELTTSDLRTMTIEILTGKPPSLRTPEADAKRAVYKRQIAEIIARGGQVDIPFEIAGGD